jgi:hypothetical protein
LFKFQKSKKNNSKIKKHNPKLTHIKTVKEGKRGGGEGEGEGEGGYLIQ